MADKYVAYVGTYTHENSVGIYVYDVDVKTGILKLQSVAPINNPSNLTVSSDGKYLYSIADEGVAAFKIDKNGDLEKINQEWVGGMRGCHVSTDSKNRFLFVSGYHDGRVTMMRLNKDGSIGNIACGIFHQGIGKSVAEKRLDPHITCVELTPDEKFLCAVDSGLHQIKVYSVDYERGKIALVGIERLPIDSSPRRLKFSKDGKFCYVITEMSNEIYVFSYETKETEPVFECVQVIPLLIGVEDEISSGTNIKLGANDEFVYASVDGLNAICMYKRDKKTGELTYIHNTYISGDYPKSFAITPEDKYLVSLNHDTNEIRTFKVDKKEGHNLMINKPIPITKPNCILLNKIGK